MSRKVLSAAVAAVLPASFAIAVGTAAASNLSIKVTDFAAYYTPGSWTTYTIVVENVGPDEVDGAIVSDPVASLAQVSAVAWTCVGAGGGTCTAGPFANSITDAINLPVHGSATYTVLANLSSAATGDLVNTVTVTPPDGVTDTDTTDNTDEDTDHEAALVFVATTGTDGPACGALAAPCRTIQAGINVAKPGDSVIVSAGTYKECIDVAPATGSGGVRVESDEHLAFVTNTVTFLDGTGVCDGTAGHPAGPVAKVHDQGSLRGFTIRGGGDSGVVGLGAVTILGNVITGNASSTFGGGVRLTTGAIDSKINDDGFKAEIRSNSIWTNTAAAAGAGIYVEALASGTKKTLVEIQGNTITGNTAGGPTEGSGGGIAVFTDTASAADSSRVLIAGNTLSGNVAQNTRNAAGAPTGDPTLVRGGGLLVATSTAGTGSETVTIGVKGAANTVRSNVSEGFGGGMEVTVQPAVGAKHTVEVAANNVSANTAKLGGGGAHATVRAVDLPAPSVTDPPPVVFHISDNSFIGNHAPGTTVAADAVGGGGGLCAELHSDRTPAAAIVFEISGNTIERNDASPYGGGASLLASASDQLSGGSIAPADASVSFHNNLVAENAAHDSTVQAVSGGGVHALARAKGGSASAEIVQEFLTVADNQAEVGSGGLEWEEQRLSNTLGSSGTTSFTLKNSIVSGNDGYGVGGTVVPGLDTAVTVSYTDTHANGSADYQPSLVGPPAVLFANYLWDPALDAFYLPGRCSPVIDAGPAAAVSDEPQPNGGHLNLGHLGNTASATRTFPDVNGDGTIDGLDVLGIATAFCAGAVCPHYFIAADRDLNGVVDGLDLSYVAAFYGQSCP